MTARTLAEMTPAERAECVGRWCDNLASTAKTPNPVVLACVQGERCWILHTTLHGEWSCFPLDAVSPRFDLPRAWTPGGQPVDMEVETGDVDRGRIWLGHQIMQRTNLPEGTTVRRYVTDWGGHTMSNIDRHEGGIEKGAYSCGNRNRPHPRSAGHSWRVLLAKRSPVYQCGVSASAFGPARLHISTRLDDTP